VPSCEIASRRVSLKSTFVGVCVLWIESYEIWEDDWVEKSREAGEFWNVLDVVKGLI
jgi:hypothetical protein